jgi:hypothetical protein
MSTKSTFVSAGMYMCLFRNPDADHVSWVTHSDGRANASLRSLPPLRFSQFFFHKPPARHHALDLCNHTTSVGKAGALTKCTALLLRIEAETASAYTVVLRVCNTVDHSHCDSDLTPSDFMHVRSSCMRVPSAQQPPRLFEAW